MTKYPESQLEKVEEKKEPPKSYIGNVPVQTIINVKIDLNKVYLDPYCHPQTQPLYTYAMQLEYATKELIKVTNNMIPEKEIRTLQDIKEWMESKVTDNKNTETPDQQRTKIITIKEIIEDLEQKLGKTIPIDNIVQQSALKNIDEDAVEEVIEKLKRAGYIFEPKRGFISRI